MFNLHFPKRQIIIFVTGVFGFMFSELNDLQAREPSGQKCEGKVIKADQGDFYWDCEDDRSQRGQDVYFCLDPVLGLTDIDAHQITRWENMRSPHAKAVALLRVPPQATMEEVRRALNILSSKGNYRTVKIIIGPL